MRRFILCACLLQAVFAAPQFLTFDHGKVGVNFGGYHAAAGLGGLLTGNAADGGLFANAGTPHGQNAAAGLNGGVGGRASGVLYAGAQATPDVGATSVLGGSTDGHGFGGAESHANGKVHSKTKYIGRATTVAEGPIGGGSVEVEPMVETNYVQKVKQNHHKRRTLIKSVTTTNDQPPSDIPRKEVVKRVYSSPHPAGSVETSAEGHISGNTDVVRNALQIPIGILRSLQESLSGLGGSAQASFHKQTYHN